MPERQFPPDVKDILADWRGCREDIHDEFDKASTSAQRGMLLAMYHAMMNIVEKNLIAPDDLEKFRKTRDQDYCLLLARECTNDANVRPDLLEQATRREVEAGRMPQDHQLRQLALGGMAMAQVEAQPISLKQIMADVESMRNKAWSLREVIQTRHKLTANIEFNLYGGGMKEEGRKALAVRSSLDEIITGATASDMVGGDLRGLDDLRKAIAMENLAEKLKIMEDISTRSKKSGISMKSEMLNILTDADRFERFTPDHQGIMKAAASGSVFLAVWRFNKLMTAIQLQAKAVQAP
jgi:hypothetical protein